MKLVRWLTTVLAVVMLTGCGAGEQAETMSGDVMTISPTEFSPETKKVLEILDDEVMFYTYIIDETVCSVDLNIWFYENGEWIRAGNVKGNEALIERDVVLRVKDTEVDLIQVSDSGQSKYTYPVTQDFSGSQMVLEKRLQTTENIVLEEEIVLYYKVASTETAFRTDDDFRSIPCSAGMALTITFSTENVE